MNRRTLMLALVLVLLLGAAIAFVSSRYETDRIAATVYQQLEFDRQTRRVDFATTYPLTQTSNPP